MDAELGPRRVDASARRMLGDPDHQRGFRDNPNRADGMVALLKEIYGESLGRTKSCCENEPADGAPPFVA